MTQGEAHEALVEKVAKLIDTRQHGAGYYSLATRGVARAVLALIAEEIKEPSEAMCRVSAMKHDVQPNQARITMWGCNVWPAMLSASPLVAEE